MSRPWRYVPIIRKHKANKCTKENIPPKQALMKKKANRFHEINELNKLNT